MVKLPMFALALAMTNGLASAQDFHYRFYKHDTNCNHNAAAGDTSPPNNQGAGSGNINSCYSAPTGTNWQRLEIDNDFTWSWTLGVETYCNVNCQGGSSPLTDGTYCYPRPPNCAIGSFKVYHAFNPGP